MIPRDVKASFKGRIEEYFLSVNAVDISLLFRHFQGVNSVIVFVMAC